MLMNYSKCQWYRITKLCISFLQGLNFHVAEVNQTEMKYIVRIKKVDQMHINKVIISYPPSLHAIRLWYYIIQVMLAIMLDLSNGLLLIRIWWPQGSQDNSSSWGQQTLINFPPTPLNINWKLNKIHHTKWLIHVSGPRTLHDLSCQFGTKGFSKEMRQIAGGSQSGLKKFLQQARVRQWRMVITFHNTTEPWAQTTADNKCQ